MPLLKHLLRPVYNGLDPSMRQFEHEHPPSHHKMAQDPFWDTDFDFLKEKIESTYTKHPTKHDPISDLLKMKIKATLSLMNK